MGGTTRKEYGVFKETASRMIEKISPTIVNDPKYDGMDDMPKLLTICLDVGDREVKGLAPRTKELLTKFAMMAELWRDHHRQQERKNKNFETDDKMVRAFHTWKGKGWDSINLG